MWGSANGARARGGNSQPALSSEFNGERRAGGCGGAEADEIGTRISMLHAEDVIRVGYVSGRFHRSSSNRMRSSPFEVVRLIFTHPTTPPWDRHIPPGDVRTAPTAATALQSIIAPPPNG